MPLRICRTKPRSQLIFAKGVIAKHRKNVLLKKTGTGPGKSRSGFLSRFRTRHTPFVVGETCSVFKALHAAGQRGGLHIKLSSKAVEPLSQNADDVRIITLWSLSGLVDMVQHPDRVCVHAASSRNRFATGKRDASTASVTSYNTIFVVDAVTDNRLRPCRCQSSAPLSACISGFRPFIVFL